MSRGGLTVSEVDELQDHLELIEPELRERLGPDEAFWVAAHRVGTPDALTRELAKVRPDMGWELRAQWVLLGLLAYMLVVPAVQVLLHLGVVAMAQVPTLLGVAAALRLYLASSACAAERGSEERPRAFRSTSREVARNQMSQPALTDRDRRRKRP